MPAAAVAPILIATTVLGATVGAVGTFMQGQQQAAAAKANAQYQAAILNRNAEIGRLNAETIRRSTMYEAEKRQERARALLARQESFYAASGIGSLEGSPLSVMGETAFQLERDVLVTKYTGRWKASMAESGADLSSFEASSRLAAGDSLASSYESAGMWGAGKSLIGGAYNVANIYGGYYGNSGTGVRGGVD